MNQKDKDLIIGEIDRRLGLLREHRDDRILQTDNQYEELNQALAKVIAAPLEGELNSLKEYIQKL